MTAKHSVSWRWVVCTVALCTVLGSAVSQAGDDADAGPSEPDITPSSWSPNLPAMWRELPSVAAQAASAAQAAGANTLEFRSHAWGDPGRGCFLFFADVTVPDGELSAVPAEIAKAIAAANFEVSEQSASPDPATNAEPSDSARSRRLFSDTLVTHL